MHPKSPQFEYLGSCTVRLQRHNLRRGMFQFEPQAQHEVQARSKGQVNHMKPYLG